MIILNDIFEYHNLLFPKLVSWRPSSWRKKNICHPRVIERKYFKHYFATCTCAISAFSIANSTALVGSFMNYYFLLSVPVG